MDIKYNQSDRIEECEAIALYEANGWSAANKPKELLKALRSSHSLITARSESKLIGLGNAISDGHLVVYYPHLLVHPDYQRNGVGKGIMGILMAKYAGFHQQMLTADGEASKFYEMLGFERAGSTVPMWIYQGDEH